MPLAKRSRMASSAHPRILRLRMSLNHSQRATFSQSTLRTGLAFIWVRAVGQQSCLANHDFPKAAEAKLPGGPGSHVAPRIPWPRKEHTESMSGHVCMGPIWAELQ